MKVKTMRERLHEAIDLANDERIIITFRSIPLEISRSKHLTLMQIRGLIKDAEEELSGSSADEEEGDDLEETIKKMHRSFFAVIRERGRSSEAAST